MTDTLVRLESYPFDSMQDGYDDDGWPVYDRAVGSALKRLVYRQFFSDGVFKREGTYFYMQPAATGLAVTVSPGAAIIRGGIGGATAETTLSLDSTSPVGRTPYSVFIRIDDDKDYRSLYLRVVSGAASADPVPPEPENSANAKELRLGYVILPSGATDMSSAEVVNEIGTDMCPFAAPFAEIDLSQIIADIEAQGDRMIEHLRTQGDATLNSMQSDLMEVRDIINTAFYDWYEHIGNELDANQAANLQRQIDALRYWYVEGNTLYIPQTAASVAGNTLIIPREVLPPQTGA